MIPNISFTSTFKVSSRYNSFNKFQQFQFLAQNESEDYNGAMEIKFKQDKDFPDYFYTECTLVTPDNRDLSVQDYCNIHGIVYKKIGHEETNALPQLEKRIIRFEDIGGKRLIKINSKKLSELIENQTTNIQRCKEEYEKEYKDFVDFIFKSDDDFLATKIVIFSNKGITKEVLEQIEEKGAQSLGENQIYIGFSNESHKPDQCMYFGFCNLGVEKVPVYTDEISYLILQKLGIVEED